LNLNQVHYLERSLFGAYGCTSSSNREALHLMGAGELDLNWLITKRVSLEDIQEGIDHAANRMGMKATVTDF